MIRIRHALARAIGLAAVLAALASPAQAGLMDFLFGKKSSEAPAADAPNAQQRQWQIGEFTAIRLVARESASPENQHPARLQPELLRQQLALVRVSVRGGVQPLFGNDELAELIGPLAQAFAVAGPGDDLLLLSTSRRGEGLLVAPTGITARMFVQGGALQLIVHDARYEFFNEYRGGHIEPKFTFGSRGTPGSPALQSATAASRRGDWLALPLAFAGQPAEAAPQAAAATVAAPQAVAPVPAPTPSAAPAATPAPVSPVAAPRVRDAAFAEEIEQRLTTLKRLRDRGLISEEEYQQKRKEVLALL